MFPLFRPYLQYDHYYAKEKAYSSNYWLVYNKEYK